MYAYGLSEGGSDWVTIRVRETATGAHETDATIHCDYRRYDAFVFACPISSVLALSRSCRL
jgi:hypothetical protein